MKTFCIDKFKTLEVSRTSNKIKIKTKNQTTQPSTVYTVFEKLKLETVKWIISDFSDSYFRTKKTHVIDIEVDECEGLLLRFLDIVT